MQEGDFGNKNRVLTSWKEIAGYLGKGVRTVQRWEKDFGLPVRRPIHSDKSAILARTADLDAWVAIRCSPRVHPEATGSRNQRFVTMRSTLAAGLTTALMLREANAHLVSEMRAAVADLQLEILRMHQASGRTPPKSPIDLVSRPQLLPLHDSVSSDAA